MCDGISQKMLTQTLRYLERDGLIHRHVLSAKPLQVRVSRILCKRRLITAEAFSPQIE